MPGNNASSIFEFRGIKDLYFAEVLKDDESEYKTSTPKRLSYTASIAKEVETSSETKFYDNQPMIVINTKGAETFTLTVAPPALGILAEITGQAFDPSLGMMIEGEIKPKMFAIGYKAKGTDGFWRFVWKYKGQFAVPSETVNTESNSIDTNNTELTYTAVSTVHKFAYTDAVNSSSSTPTTKTASGVVVDERYGQMTEDLKTDWCTEVQTPEKVKAAINGAA
ncbi:MAG: hypothetical protein K2H01_01590 [Ruminococcus sp.]|nr:hypothetical protein [Ruminococcus sp.]